MTSGSNSWPYFHAFFPLWSSYYLHLIDLHLALVRANKAFQILFGVMIGIWQHLSSSHQSQVGLEFSSLKGHSPLDLGPTSVAVSDTSGVILGIYGNCWTSLSLYTWTQSNAPRRTANINQISPVSKCLTFWNFTFIKQREHNFEGVLISEWRKKRKKSNWKLKVMAKKKDHFCSITGKEHQAFIITREMVSVFLYSLKIYLK